MVSRRDSRKESRTTRPKARSPQEIPDKPYFKIGEVAALAGVAPSVLRFWETEFRSLKPQKSKTNQRVYTRKHAELVLQIRELLYDRGFTISGARKKLREGGGPVESENGDVLEKMKKEVKELLRLLDG